MGIMETIEIIQTLETMATIGTLWIMVAIGVFKKKRKKLLLGNMIRILEY